MLAGPSGAGYPTSPWKPRCPPLGACASIFWGGEVLNRLPRWLSTLTLGCFFAVALPAAAASNASPGAFDPSFGTGGLVVTDPCQHAHAWASALQPDGKIVLAGDCSTANGFDPRYPPEVLVVRLTADGVLDPAFGVGGAVASQVGVGATPSSVANAMVLQQDGKVVAGGQATDASGHAVFMIVRLDADGSFDSTFGTGGIVTGSSLPDVNALALEPEGKIVVGGADYVARLDPDGRFDSSFGSNGVSPVGGNVAALALQPDGKIVVGGADYVARLDPDGGLDSSFGSNGVSPAGGNVAALALQPDGKIVAGGRCTDDDGHTQLLIFRLDGNGELDPSFGDGGAVTAQLSAPVGVPSSYVQALALQPDGKLLAAGAALDFSYWNDAFVLRLRTDGSIDTSFGTSGGLSGRIPRSGFSTLVLQPDGKLVAAGSMLIVHDVTGMLAARLIVDVPPAASFGVSPGSAVAGQAVTFDGAASSDADGSIAGYAWSFGDSSTATGSTPTHTYAAPGSYTVTLTVTDDYGLTDSVSKVVDVTLPAPLLRPEPRLSLVRLRPHSFRAAGRGASIASRGGATVSYLDSLAARTRFRVDRVLTGRVSVKACTRPSAGNRHARRCLRYARLRGSFDHQDRKGANRFHFTGRLRSQRLAPGNYRLDATPTAGGQTGTTIHIGFRIIR